MLFYVHEFLHSLVSLLDIRHVEGNQVAKMELFELHGRLGFNATGRGPDVDTAVFTAS
jgi:hypothetical protein